MAFHPLPELIVLIAYLLIGVHKKTHAIPGMAQHNEAKKDSSNIEEKMIPVQYIWFSLILQMICIHKVKRRLTKETLLEFG
jgi:hypothetical protein|tara:strand:- start:79993 stop:80235 length:243 start_codon:yes stop_codon:yes gene_type:complete